MKKKFFLGLFTLMFTMLLFTSSVKASSPDIRSYEYANNNTRLHSSSHKWNDGLFYYYERTGQDLRPYISDFTPKLTLNIVGPREIHVIFAYPTELMYYDEFYYSDYYYNSVTLFNYGNMNYAYNSFTYVGNYYGDANHRNGTNVQPFFLFINGTGTAYAPSFVDRYNSSYYYASFTLPSNLPTNQNFKMGISFSTTHLDYFGDAYDYYSWEVGSSNIVMSDNLYLNY